MSRGDRTVPDIFGPLRRFNSVRMRASVMPRRRLLLRCLWGVTWARGPGPLPGSPRDLHALPGSDRDGAFESRPHCAFGSGYCSRLWRRGGAGLGFFRPRATVDPEPRPPDGGHRLNGRQRENKTGPGRRHISRSGQTIHAKVNHWTSSYGRGGSRKTTF